jgi:hypothetical protein
MFFYSLPIFFNDIKLASPIECLLMAVAVFVALYISAPPPEQNWRQQPFDSFLLTSWLGGVSLYWVFWPFFIFLNSGLFAADLMAKTGAITVSSWDEIHFILLFTVAWWVTSVWRCSGNTQARIWAALARFLPLPCLLNMRLSC